MPKHKKHELFQLAIALFFAIGLPAAVFQFAPVFRSMPPLLSFNEGIWRNGHLPMEQRSYPGLKAPVEIAFDGSGIPHIVAQNDDDLFFAEGVLTASDRLFQMEISARVGTGELSQILGRSTLDYDRFFVTFGMREAVHAEAAELMKDPRSAQAIRSYVAGINAYIRQLSYADLPIEYKLIGAWPREWSAESVASLLKIMTFRLAGRSNDLRLTKILEALGKERTEALFPEFLPNKFEAYFGDSGSAKTRQDFSWNYDFVSQLKSFPNFLQPVEVNGSNSWAIGPAKSKTGASVLANDTHLGLQLPAFWYEAQLISPDMNVYGVTFPGSPGIILGFNQKLAWGSTNGTTDVLDWYQVEFKGADSLQYKFGDEWREATVTNQSIEIKGEKPEVIRVLHTDYGYVMSRQSDMGLAAIWTGYDTSNELKVVLGLDRASSVQECLEALRDWKAPVQNFTCADSKNISIYHAGRIPKRISGQGRVVQAADGEKSLWQGEIPFEDLPHAINPPQGFVFSANERPVGPSYPYYLGWDYEEPFRAQRIRTLLTERHQLDGGDFIQMQNDIMNQHAAEALPFMLKHSRVSALTEKEKSLFESLKQWDFLERAKSIEPSLFEAWWAEVEALLWHNLKIDDRPFFPSKARTILFFHQWEEDKEKYQDWVRPFSSLNDLFAMAFHKAIEDLKKNYGEDASLWQWDLVQKTHLDHVAKLPGFGAEVVMDGGKYAVMANAGGHGPAWKLVVELGSIPRAWAQFPGGESGNPLDPDYEKFVQPWSRGEMRSVEFSKDGSKALADAQYTWHWRPQ